MTAANVVPDAIHAVVVTYNTADLAVALLTDLHAELVGVPGSRIVVFDNASTDGTASRVQREVPGVTVIASPRNLGFGRAVNAAAAGAETRWLLLINPDARIDPGAIAELIGVAKAKPGHGIYGGRFVDERRDSAKDSVAVVPTLRTMVAFGTGLDVVGRRIGRGRFEPGAIRQALGNEVVEVAALPGTFLLVETAAWREVGGFDERFFMYSEDIDLCGRMRRTGRRPLYVPQASIRHAGGASSTSGGKEVLKMTSLVTYIRTWWDPVTARAAVVFLLSGVLLRRVAHAPARDANGRWETAWRERRSWRAGW